MSSPVFFEHSAAAASIRQALPIAGLVLSAGKGTRMKSSLPKVLHKISGKTMIQHVTDRLIEAGIKDLCMVVSEDLTPFQPYMHDNPGVRVCIQKNRNGTAGAAGAAANCFLHGRSVPFAPSVLAKGEVLPHEFVLICAGDAPAVLSEDLKIFTELCLSHSADVAVLGMDIPSPEGYGRLISEGNARLRPLNAVIEEKDASPEEKQITECNSGIIFARVSLLFDLLAGLTNQNSQKEYYLTDIVAEARKRNQRVLAFISQSWQNFQGVNTPEQLNWLEDFMEGYMSSPSTSEIKKAEI